MSIRNQPFLKLYVQDFMTDEKLINCSAASVGVYIRLICYLHKCDDYGKVLLKQKFKQNAKQIKNFALQFANILPYDITVIEDAFSELFDEGVITIEGDLLYQKRMVKDAQISDSRAKTGKIGGQRTQNKNKDFAKAKVQAKNKQNCEYEYEYDYELEEIEDRKEDRRGCKGEEGEKEEGREEGKKSLYVIPEMWATWKRARPGYPADQSLDFEPLQKIGAFISKQEGIPWIPQNRTEIDKILTIWLGIGEFIHSDGFFSKYSLKQVSSHIQSICQSYAKKQSSSSGNFDEEFDRAFAKMRGQ